MKLAATCNRINQLLEKVFWQNIFPLSVFWKAYKLTPVVSMKIHAKQPLLRQTCASKKATGEAKDSVSIISTPQIRPVWFAAITESLHNYPYSKTGTPLAHNFHINACQLGVRPVVEEIKRRALRRGILRLYPRRKTTYLDRIVSRTR